MKSLARKLELWDLGAILLAKGREWGVGMGGWSLAERRSMESGGTSRWAPVPMRLWPSRRVLGLEGCTEGRLRRGQDMGRRYNSWLRRAGAGEEEP